MYIFTDIEGGSVKCSSLVNTLRTKRKRKAHMCQEAENRIPENARNAGARDDVRQSYWRVFVCVRPLSSALLFSFSYIIVLRDSGKGRRRTKPE